MHHPRYTPPGALERVLAKTTADPAPFDAQAKGAGLRLVKGWWTVRGQPVARLRACVPGRVEVLFVLPPVAVASLKKAANADVFPTFDAVVSKRPDMRVTPADAARRKREVSGSLAVLGNPEDAGALVVEAAVTCYSEDLHAR